MSPIRFTFYCSFDITGHVLLLECSAAFKNAVTSASQLLDVSFYRSPCTRENNQDFSKLTLVQGIYISPYSIQVKFDLSYICLHNYFWGKHDKVLLSLEHAHSRSSVPFKKVKQTEVFATVRLERCVFLVRLCHNRIPSVW